MPETAAQTVLRRKLAPSRPPKVPGQDALRHLLAKTMPRDADQLLGLEVAVLDVAPGQLSKAGVIASLQPFDLIYLMRSDDGPPGLCSVSPELLNGLIELQMSGRVSRSDAPERRPTRTDGIVASDIVDRWIATAKAEAAAQDISDRLPFRDYFRSGSILGERNTELALDPGEFRTLEIGLNLSDGVKSGKLFFAVPLRRLHTLGTEENTAEEFRGVVMESEARLNIVLTRLPRSIAEVRRMSVGDVLEIPIETLRAVTVEATDGHAVAMGRLGQLGGQKAVRIEVERKDEKSEQEPLEFMGATMGVGEGPAGEDAGQPDLPLPSVDPVGAESESPDQDLPDLPELPDLPD